MYQIIKTVIAGSTNVQMLLQYQCMDKFSLDKLNQCPVVNKTRSSICAPLSNPETQFEKQWCEPDPM